MISLLELLLIGAFVMLILPGSLRLRFLLVGSVIVLGMVFMIEQNTVTQSAETPVVAVSESAAYTLSGEDAVKALTQDGVAVSVSVTLYYNIDYLSTESVGESWGERYADELLRPLLRFGVREIVSSLDSGDLWDDQPGYTTLTTRLEEQLRDHIELEGFVVGSVVVSELEFPPDFVPSE